MVNVKNINKSYSIRLYIFNNIKFDQYTVLGETEKKSGNKIKFATPFEINYFFQKEQQLSGDLIDNEELICKFDIKLAEIMSSKDLSKKNSFFNENNNNKIRI